MAGNGLESRMRWEPVREQPWKFTLEQPAEGFVGGAGALTVKRGSISEYFLYVFERFPWESLRW